MVRPAPRRLAVVLPLLLAATVLPIVRPAQAPRVRTWRLALTPKVQEAPADFSLVGLGVPGDAPSKAQVRVSRDGKRWGSWSTLEFEAEVGPDLGGSETGAHTSMPLWTGRSRFFQVRGAPRGSTLHAVDPGPDPTASLPAAVASPSAPRVIHRSEWGADESIRKGKPAYDEPLRFAVVHHTATADSYSSSQSDDIVRSIYAYHVKSNGWDDIGYNFLVDRFGRIYEGRYGGTNRTVIGAHAVGFNRNSTGVSIIGNFASRRPPDATMSSLKRILSWRLDQGFVDPKGSITYTSGGSGKYPKGQRVRLSTIVGHRDVGTTECPGNPTYAALPALRSAVAADGVPKLYNPTLSRPVITPNGDGVADGLSVSGRFSSNVSWKIEVINHRGGVLQTVSGAGSTFRVPWYGKNQSGTLAPHDDYRFRISAKNSVGTVKTAYIPFQVWRYPTGTYFMPSSGRSYILHNGVLRHPSVALARATRYGSGEIVKVSSNLLKAYRVGSDIGFRDGSIVRVDSKLYLISNSTRRPISQTRAVALGFDPDAFIDTTAAAVKPHKLGSTVAASDGFPHGTALHSTTGSDAWMLSEVARPFFTVGARRSWMIRDDERAGPADAAIAEGAMSKALGYRDGTLVKSTESDTVYVLATGKRHPFSSARAFSKMGYDSANIRTITPAELAFHTAAPAL